VKGSEKLRYTCDCDSPGTVMAPQRARASVRGRRAQVAQPGSRAAILCGVRL
jgi:hypothetical protein